MSRNRKAVLSHGRKTMRVVVETKVRKAPPQTKSQLMYGLRSIKSHGFTKKVRHGTSLGKY